jgi:hypothetical protein
MAACGSDSKTKHDSATYDGPTTDQKIIPDLPVSPDLPKDVVADVAPADLPIGVDVVAPVDLPVSPDVVADLPIGVDVSLPDSPINPDVAIDIATPLDTSIDTNAIDGTPLDTVSEAGVVGFPCRDDSDCCIVVDDCMSVAYLYSKAPGAAPPPGGFQHTNCATCMPPTVQVRCISGQCLGEKVPFMAALLSSHCGYVVSTNIGPDAGPSIDAGTPQVSVWNCGP